MNVITDTLRELVRRRLWPVALLLIAAAVAAPLVLAKEPEVAPLASAPKAAQVDEIPATFVTSAAPSEAKQRKRVLGSVKDPFEPAPLPKAKKKQAKASATPTPTPEPTPTSGGGSGGGGAAPAPTATPTPTATAAPKVPRYSIRVRFGKTDEGATELTPTTIERLTALPDDDNPVLVYRGVEKNGKVAVFELTGLVDAQGDGRCAPKPDDCQVLKLRVGETEFITVTETGDETDAQYQLDLIKIYAD